MDRTYVPFERAPRTHLGAAYESLAEVLEEYPPAPHHHSRIVMRSRFWRLWCRYVLRWSYPYWEQAIERVPCNGLLCDPSKITFRTEDEDMCVKVVAWRMWRCQSPSIPDGGDAHGNITRYAAAKIPFVELDQAKHFKPSGILES